MGSWIQIGNHEVVEILAASGFSWLAIDREHTAIELGDLPPLFTAMEKHNVVPFVRVAENNPIEIRKTLDLGAKGVIVPLVNSELEARRAVAAARYSPRGVRGYSFSRANLYGREFREELEDAEENIAVIAMIESREAVENIHEILAVEGIDGVFVGPYDLSGSYALPGELDALVVQDAIGEVLASCKKHGKSAGMHIVMPEPGTIKRAITRGFTFLALGMDTSLLRVAADKVLHGWEKPDV